MKFRILIAFVTAFAIMMPTSIVNANSISELERNLIEIEEATKKLEKEKKEKEEEKKYHEEKMEELEGEIEGVEKKLKQLQGNINKVYAEIYTLNEKIEEKEAIIEELKQEIANKKDELKTIKEKLANNLYYMSSNGKVKMLEFIFRADNLSDFFNRYQIMDKVNKEGEKLYKSVQTKLKEIETLEKKEEKELNNLTVMRKELNAKKEKLNAQKLESERLQEKLNKKYEEHKSHHGEIEDALKQIASQIKNKQKTNDEIIRQIEMLKEEKRKRELQLQHTRQSNSGDAGTNNDRNENQNNSAPVSSGGPLYYPMKPGTYYISSYYGYRTDPITGQKGAFHAGVDFAAPAGTSIYAAQDGYVMFAGPASGFGNWIVIQHLNGLYTVYGHMYSNGIYVRPGQYVLAGDKIGAVGSAGKSTGPHLHFSVATGYNGYSFNYVNPMGYLR